MAKIQRKKRDEVSEAEVLKILNQGGKSIQANRVETVDVPKRIQLRLYPNQIADIDDLRAMRRGSNKVSRHAWIVEAIEEKMKRERDTYKP